MVKKQKQSTHPAEKTLTIAGIAVVIFGVIASIYNAIISARFIYSPDDAILYLNFLILLGGGFAVGYLLTRKDSRANKLFVSPAYALIAFAVYLLLDALRILTRTVFGDTFEDIDIAIFQYSPLIALAITTLLAYLFQFRSKHSELTTASKYTLITTFLALQVYNIGYIVYFYATTPSTSSVTAPLWFDIAGIITHPVFIAVAAFLLLGRVKSVLLRLFYAVFIAALSSIFMQVSWNFRIDPSLDATLAFQGLSYILGVLLAAILIWKIRINTK